MRIQHNLSALNTHRNLNFNNTNTTKTLEKLSSGYKINRAGDDAAGLAISEKMRAQIRGLTMANKNAQDGVSLIQTAEGALNEVHAMIQRLNELAVQAANETNTLADREALQKEISQIINEVDKVSGSTEFNSMKLLDGSFSKQTTTANGTTTQPKQEASTLTYNLRTGSLEWTTLEARDNSLEGAIGLANTNNEVANIIANDLVPNSIEQLFKAFPALKDLQGLDKVEIGLRIYSNSNSSVLAYAQAGYSDVAGEKPLSITLAVNTAKFPDVESLDGTKAAGELEATIMHELMHVAMQYNMPDGLAGNRGQQYPMWFLEGIAQAAGGGFTAQWNEWLRDPFVGMNFGILDGEDAVRKWSLNDATYGEYAQGYVATMYLGHLAGGGARTGTTPDVNANTIRTGLNNILEKLGEGKSFSDAIKETTGLSQTDIEGMFGPNATASSQSITNLGYFVNELGFAVGYDGAGSVVADGGLSAKPIKVINQEEITTSPIYIGKMNLGNGVIDLYDPDQNTPPVGWVNPNTGVPTPDPNQGGAGTGGNNQGGTNPTPNPGGGTTPTSKGGLTFHVGANAGQTISLNIEAMNSVNLGIDNINITTTDGATKAITSAQKAIQKVSEQRAELGAVQNRLEHTINSLDNTAENLSSAESRIRDADMAQEMMKFTKQSILMQAAQAMITQANTFPQSVLSLLS